MIKSVKRIIVISDTHGKESKLNIPEGDILIHAGDFTRTGLEDEITQFSNWLGKLPHKHKIVIAGNHEITFDLENEKELKESFYGYSHKNQINFKNTKALLKNCIYVEHNLIEVEGLKIFGTPYQPVFYHWAFNREEIDREKLMKEIPSDIDILITHGPPNGILDYVPRSKTHAGCKFLLKEVNERIKPRLHVFGHIHEAYGWEKNQDTLFLNASNCNLRYEAINKPFIVDLDSENKSKKADLI